MDLPKKLHTARLLSLTLIFAANKVWVIWYKASKELSSDSTAVSIACCPTELDTHLMIMMYQRNVQRLLSIPSLCCAYSYTEM